MKTWLIAQFVLYLAFFFLPQALLALFGGTIALGWAHVAGAGMFAFIAFTARGDSVPLRHGSLLQVTPLAKALVLGSFIALQLVDGAAVLEQGHQILYLEARPSSALIWRPLKILGAGGIYLAVVLLTQARRLRDEPVATAALASTLATGTRGLFFFCVVAIALMRNDWRSLVRLRYFVAASALVVVFAWLGTVRDDLDSEAGLYGLLIVQTLNQFVSSNINSADCGIAPATVLTQVAGILKGTIDDGRVTYQLTSCVSPEALDEGYGIASSAVGEFGVLLGSLGSYAFVLVPLAYAALLATGLRGRSRFTRSVSAATAPFVLYAVRAELLFPLVFFAKALVGLFGTMLLDAAILALFAGARTAPCPPTDEGPPPVPGDPTEA